MTLDGQTAAILGLGLIGGSMARDLSALGVRVLGYDVDAATLDAARSDGVSDERLDASLSKLDQATIVILAVPVSATHELLSAASRHLGGARLIMDVGSTKRAALDAAASLGLSGQFVGSHPMAGDHRSGWSAARRGLFAGATTYLCPTTSTSNEAMQLARDLWTALGARLEVIDADAHDERVAFTSHLPHVASAALALALAHAKVKRDDLGPGGRDVLRIAASSPEMWTAIAVDNADSLLRAVSDLETQLQRFRAALAASDDRALLALFDGARNWTGREA